MNDTVIPTTELNTLYKELKEKSTIIETLSNTIQLMTTQNEELIQELEEETNDHFLSNDTHRKQINKLTEENKELLQQIKHLLSK